MSRARGAAVQAVPDDVFVGGGEMGARMRAYDWSSTPLGPPETWPQSLKTTVGIMLTSRYAMWMGWGDALTFFCNDAYLPTLGVKDKWALGARAEKVWEEIWPDIGPRIAQVLSTGIATWDEGLLLVLERSGYPEETYHTFSYSPLRDDGGVITGLFCVVTEETKRVIDERRLGTLRDLGAALSATQTEAQVVGGVESALGANRRDLPFTMLYLFEGPDGAARLASATGLPPEHPARPKRLAAGTSHWAVSELWRTGAPVLVDDLSVMGTLPPGDWQTPPRQALLLPIAQRGHATAGGFLVTGINPFRPMDTDYSGFLNLVAGQVGAGLANAQAYEAERQRAESLAELDRAKTTFFSNISHEFRTPLTLMLGPLEEILQRPAPGDIVAQAATAHRNGQRLLKMVNALLDFSRIEAGRMQASFQPTELGGFTSELASSFRSAMERGGLRFTVDTPALARPVHVDRDMWEKIVLNLVSNAFKFTLSGGVDITLRDTGAAAVLTVRDTGAGIPEDQLPLLFERFHRVEGSRGRTFEGSGIGLALVQELVKLHGGEIEVDSRLGEGSTFTITIPFGTEHLPPDQLRGDHAAAPDGTRARAFVEEALRWLPGEAYPDDETLASLARDADVDAGPPTATGRVVLADDNADMRDYVRRLLTGRGYEVEAVGDGQAALEAIRRNPPDLVLSDVMMPVLDGFALLRAIRGDDRLREISVVLLSARAGEEARVEGVDAGADDYLTKPFSARELLARVGANISLARVRQEALQSLREMNATLDARVAERTRERDRLWRNSQDLLCVAGPDGMIQSVNPAWAALLGWQPEELIGRPSLDLIHPDDVAPSVVALGHAVQRGHASTENRLRHKDGSYRWLSWTAASEEGVIYANGRDITAEKDQAEALRQAEDALRQAQKMEAVGQLTGGIAHDFNNLLAGILGSLELMQTRIAQGRTEDLRRYNEAATQSARRAASLTHRLLAFSRRQTLDAKPTDANRLVGSMEELIRRTMGPAITVELVISAGLWMTLCDANQLENALLNLAINARDAMPDGGRLTIETANARLDAAYAATQRDVTPGQYISISVSDTGVGMTAEVLERAVDPFFTTKPTGQGTGLGLSMIYGFAKQSNGHLRIYSEPGKGTTVRLYLPRYRGDGAAALHHEADKTETIVAGKGETVLVVDDEPIVRMLIIDVLTDLGYTAIEAADGPEGLRIVQSEERIDLVVSDVGLPGGINGRQLADAARQSRPDLKVLFITGYAESAAVGHGHLEPGMQVITKPFAMDDLAAKIRAMIEDAPGGK